MGVGSAIGDEGLRSYLLENFGQAIERGRIRPVYLAVVRSQTGLVCGEEALARWDDSQHGLLMPDQFIPILEDAGLMPELDLHMVDCVIADMEAKRKQGVPLVPVSVNVSFSNATECDIAREIVLRMNESGLPSELLQVEFAEPVLTECPELFREQAATLRDAGIGVWIDDFGSGPYSLQSLHDFPLDAVKLDRSITRDLNDETERHIVSSLLHLAKKLNITVLAEGVESEDQAVFLEGAGCDMMQGFFFSEPLALETLIANTAASQGIPREDTGEASYFNVIGSIDLTEPFQYLDNRAADGSLLSGFPAGIVEHRDGVWRILRANAPYREFLAYGKLLSANQSSLEAHETERDVDGDFVAATMKSKASGMWERVAGRLEYGTGLQFYTRIIASTEEADAFMLTAIPTMLGTVLGSYGDIPVAYAVLRVVLNAEGTRVTDCEYVYANTVYCDLCDYDPDTLEGRSFRALSGEESDTWFAYFYDAAVRKQRVDDVLYSPEVQHWLSFVAAPTSVEGCCVYAFTIADDERRERQEMIIGRDTSDFIIAIANVFNGANDFDAAMSEVLDMVSKTIHPDRLYIFEQGERTTSVTYEWCAEGIESKAAILQNLPNSDFGTWKHVVETKSIVAIPHIDEIKETDPRLYADLRAQGVSSLLAAPLFDGTEVNGFIVADNYVFEEGFDTRRLLETVGGFISSHIANKHLLDRLEKMGKVDALTGLLNRRGFDEALFGRMDANPNEPYALALIDIDDFKTINDVYGHDRGDEALKLLAHEIRRVAPSGTILGRNGGDEFVAALFGEDAHHAEAMFAALQESNLTCSAGDAPADAADGEGESSFDISLSIGFAGCPDEARDLRDAYLKADAALYAVKLTGKHGFRRYTPDVESQYRSQLGFTPRDIAENIAGAIMVHRVEAPGEILFANDELIRMFECDSLSDFMEYTGGTFRGIVHPEDRRLVYEKLVKQADLTAAGKKSYCNYRIITKRGNIRHVADNGRLVDIDRVGMVTYVLLINQDERNAVL